MKKIKIPKILAPAGSFDSLVAGLKAGADEVYFGVAGFNMRVTAAKNFELTDLPKIAELCKKYNVKTNLTVNTVLYNSELDKMRDIIKKAKEAGIDGIICADIAAVEFAYKLGMKVSISTQLSISNTHTVNFFSKYADRIILARELTLEQIKKICSDIKELNIKGPSEKLMEIEIFGHGALCVAVSGRCAMSLYHYNTSANRGRCAQICRRRFKVRDIETNKELEIDNNYIMSSADLCTIGMLKEIVNSGIAILKLEGRGRPPEYVDTVVSCYKEALDSIKNKSFSNEKVKNWKKKLNKVFNRGFFEGFFRGRKFDEWAKVHGSKSTMEKTIAGHVKHYFSKIKVAHVKIDAKIEVNQGEKFLITGPTTGIVKGKLTEILKDNKKIKRATQDEEITFKVSKKVRKNDKFFVWRKRKSKYPKGKKELLS